MRFDGVLAVSELARNGDDAQAVQPEPAPHIECECAICKPKQEPWSRGSYHQAREAAIVEFERDYVGALLNHVYGNVSQAARIAGMNRATIYRLIDRHRRHGGTHQ